MAGNVLTQRGAVYLASRSTAATGKALHLFEDVIRNRDSCFHTGSITAAGGRLKPGDRSIAQYRSPEQKSTQP